MSKDHEQQRRQLWCDAYIAYVAADNSVDKYGGESWADAALAAFDKRFPKTRDEKPTKQP